MIVKQYQGKTEEEAIAKAKKELGENVTIMGVKKVRKGFFGFLRPKVVELNAAIEEEQERPAIRQSLPPLKPIRTANPTKPLNPQIIPEPAGPVKEEKTEKSGGNCFIRRRVHCNRPCRRRGRQGNSTCSYRDDG